MILRRGRYGEFWGCVSFPKCKNTIRISKNVGGSVFLTFAKTMSDIYNRVLEFWNAREVSLVQPIGYDTTAARFREAVLNPAEDLTKL